MASIWFNNLTDAPNTNQSCDYTKKVGYTKERFNRIPERRMSK